MQTLKPPRTESSTGSTSSKTAAWCDSGPKTQSKVNDLRPSLPGFIVIATSVSEKVVTADSPSSRPAGRTRHMTRIEPLISCSSS